MRKNKALLKILSNPVVIRRYYSSNIYRGISEAGSVTQLFQYTEWSIVVLVSCILIILILWTSLQINGQIRLLTERQQKHRAIEEERNYWQQIVSEYPGYRDAYFRLAVLEYQLGEEEKALQAVTYALRLDPRFEAGHVLREKILRE